MYVKSTKLHWLLRCLRFHKASKTEYAMLETGVKIKRVSNNFATRIEVVDYNTINHLNCSQL